MDAETSSGNALKGLIAEILLLGTALLIITNRIRRHGRTTADAWQPSGQPGAGAH
ncbi:hypothetical protein ACWGF2_28690 [Streptomyces sp. NPDC054919]